MLISLRLIVVSVISLSCLASAFSTLFVTEGEGAGEGRKMEEMETRTQKMERNNVAENQVIVETIPFFTDIFSKVEDVMNLTPLKVATIISGQHLINAVKSIPVSGNLPQDTLNMLSNIFDEFNKTTEIIKLTAEYVNISSHYMLNSLDQFSKSNCNREYVQNTMQTINRHFLDVISRHIKVAIRELTEKTDHREITGTDVLVTSAYHIVAAFQEMTNNVMSLKTDNGECDIQKPQTSKEQVNLLKNNESNIFENLKLDVTHKSIKKDQALPNQPIFTSQENFQDTLTIENVGTNPDLTIEIYPRDPFILNEKGKEPLATEKVKIPESLKVAFLPETETKVQSKALKKKKNMFQSQLEFENNENGVKKKNAFNLSKIFSINRVNPNKNLNSEIFSTRNIKKQELPTIKLGNSQQKLDSFNVYYYPLKTLNQNKKNLPKAKTNNNLKVPEGLRANYYLHSIKAQTDDQMHLSELKQVMTPFKTFSLFGNVDFENSNEEKPQKKEHIATKSEGSQTVGKNLDDTLTIKNANRQDLTVEVFSPEAFMHNDRDESSAETKQVMLDPTNIKETKTSPETEMKTDDLKNMYTPQNHDHKRFDHKDTKINQLDRELTSSAVDSLSNAPSMSYDTRDKVLRNRKSTKRKLNGKKSLSTVLMPWVKRIPQFQNALFHKNHQKLSSCHEKVEPTCGIDKNKSNFIIFPNDCQRKHHNELYKTNYEWTSMDTCVRFLVGYSSEKSTKNINSFMK